MVISKGHIVQTLNGCLHIHGYDGIKVSCTGYEFDYENDRSYKLGDWLLTLSEIEDMMYESDGRHHKVEWED